MAHLHNGESRFDKTLPEWLAVGTQINDLANKWSLRDDIVTYVGEGAGHGAPACFIPKIAEMEVDVRLAFGEETDPTFVPDLTVRGNQFDFPVAMGAVLHEAGHAKHTLFSLEEVSKLPHVQRELVTWFEETRIENRMVTQYPENRSFLRACAMKLVVGDLSEDKDFTDKGIIALSNLILLTLARVDAGILDESDVEPVQTAVEGFLGATVLADLGEVWRKAQEHSEDGNWEPLRDLADEWIRILQEAGHDPEKEAEEQKQALKDLLESMMGSGSGEGEDGEDGEGSGGGILQDMADEIAEAAAGEAVDQSVTEHREEATKARKDAAKEAEQHKKEAEDMMGHGRGTGPGSAHTSSRLTQERDPKPEERAAAVALGKALERARYRDRVVVKRSSVVPPGRLNARRALAASEQKSRGVEITAEAWKRKQRFHTDDPTLDIGVMVDISGSMSYAMEPMASAAWVLSEAVRRVQGRVGMVYYGNDAFPVLKPGQHLDKVSIYSAPDGTERFSKAFKALDGSLNLLNGSGARLLVVVSDLYYMHSEYDFAKEWMKRCKAAGVAVIVVPFDHESTAQDMLTGVPGVEVIPNRLTGDIVGAAKAIGNAAVRQLEAVSG